MLKPWWKSMEDDHKSRLIVMEREKKLHRLCITTFPEILEAQISMNDMGMICIRAFIYLKLDNTEKDTQTAVKWLTKIFKKAERDFREGEGRFMWKGQRKMEDENGKYNELIFIENANKQNCEIVKVTKEVEVYEAKCPNGV